MSRRRHDPSIENEPHLRGDSFSLDPSEEAAAQTLARRGVADGESRAEHGVWDEPGLSRELAGTPDSTAWTYARWLEARSRGVTASRSWLTVVAVAAAAGPWAILGTLLGTGTQSFIGIVLVVVFGPAVEEIMKVSIALWVVEKRPFLFRSALQLVVCGLAGGAAFAAVENVLYLHWQIPSPSAGLVQWRWTVCLGMHVVCTFIASLGLIRIWRDAWERKARPRPALLFPYIVAATVVHGSYNAFAVALAVADYQF